jgi:hypothetical protein
VKFLEFLRIWICTANFGKFQSIKLMIQRDEVDEPEGDSNTDLISLGRGILTRDASVQKRGGYLAGSPVFLAEGG